MHDDEFENLIAPIRAEFRARGAQRYLRLVLGAVGTVLIVTVAGLWNPFVGAALFAGSVIVLDRQVRQGPPPGSARVSDAGSDTVSWHVR